MENILKKLEKELELAIQDKNRCFTGSKQYDFAKGYEMALNVAIDIIKNEIDTNKDFKEY